MIRVNNRIIHTNRRYLTANGIIKVSKEPVGHDIKKYRVYGVGINGREHITNKRTICVDEFTEFAVVYDQ